MKKLILSFFAAAIYTTVFSQTDPIIVTILSSEPVSGITNIQYEFSGTYLSYDIDAEVSFDSDPYQPIPIADLSGDLDNVAPGVRNIVWNGAASFSNYYHLQTRIRITATPNFNCGGQITDIDGNVYNTVLIGTQCWMKENLNTTRDADGNAISRYCYNNDPSNCAIYGGLYTWATAMNGAASSNNVPSGVRGICPSGWHFTSDAEWTALTDYVSSQPEYLCDANTSYISKALAAQSNFQTHWYTCAVGNNLTLNNATGFSALPGGFRHLFDFFNLVGYSGFWWTSSESDDEGAWFRGIGHGSPEVYLGSEFKGYGISVRCLRD